MAVRVATCRKCEADINLDHVIGMRDSEDSRRLVWVCEGCGKRDTFTYTFQEYKELLKAHYVEEKGYDSDLVGRMVQGFRIELDRLDEDWDVIVGWWKFTEEVNPWDVPREQLTSKFKGLGGLVVEDDS